MIWYSMTSVNKEIPSDKELLDNFQCVRCGNCCRWPGYVKVTPEEVEAIANFLSISFEEMMDKYVDLTHDRKHLTLIERVDGGCVFLDDKELPTCILEDVKPLQCRKFPYKWNFPGWKEKCAGAPATLEKLIKNK